METPKKKPRLIIVDDEPDIAEVLAVLLEDYFQCDISTCGQDTLKKIGQISYDTLITDLEMPDLPGLDIIEAAKNLNNNIKIFISTGHAKDSPQVKRATEIGIDGILQKPFAEPEELIKILRQEVRDRAVNSSDKPAQFPGEYTY